MAQRLINVAIIGCGRISRKHALAIQAHPQARIKVACDINMGRANRLASEYEIPFACEDYHWVLSQEEIDLVHICTPSHLHATMTMSAASAGKHVLVEKPQALWEIEARSALKACMTANVKYGVILQNRYNPPIHDLTWAIKDRNLGKLLMLSAVVRWYRPQKYYEDDWHGDPHKSGGVVMNQAMHHIDLLRLYGGWAKDIRAFDATLAHEIKAADTCVAAIRFTNGALGTFEASTVAYPKNAESSITVIGERGTIKVGGTALNRKIIWRVEGELEQEDDILRRQEIDPPGVYGQGHIAQIADMIQAIIDDRPPAIDGYEALKSLIMARQITSAASAER